jgi:L-threonylcarbamoyladenylate synthase
LDGKIAAVLDGGRSRIGVESTVLDLTRPVPTILRPGGVTKEDLEHALGIRLRMARRSGKRPASPGMKYRHYAPKAELVLLEGEERDVVRVMKQIALSAKSGRSVGIMGRETLMKHFARSGFYSLGKTNRDAEQRLFNGFRMLDKKGVDMILCQSFEEKETGSALMNRLRKAATRIMRV